MGSGASSAAEIPASSPYAAVFFDNTALECADLFAVSNSSTDFVNYIKDGSWVDNLFQTKILFYRNQKPKTKTYSVAFLPSTSSLAPSDADENLSSFRSVRSLRSQREGATEPVVSDLCPVIEDRTCFNNTEMISCLFSIIYPLYLSNFNTYDKLLNGEEISEVETLTNLGEQEPQMHKLQEILLDSVVLCEEGELKNALESTNWLEVLEASIKASVLGICVCSVEQTSGSTVITPVLANDRAKKCSKLAQPDNSPAKKKVKIDTIDTSVSVQRQPRHPFLQVWGIDDEEQQEEDVMRSLTQAQPVRLIAKKCVGKARVVVDVTHIFDDQGVHRYVLSVMMDIPQDAAAKRRMQYLSDTSLLLSHLIKVPPTSPPPAFTSQNTIVSAPSAHL
eukprot:gene14445-16586_t